MEGAEGTHEVSNLSGGGSSSRQSEDLTAPSKEPPRGRGARSWRDFLVYLSVILLVGLVIPLVSVLGFYQPNRDLFVIQFTFVAALLLTLVLVLQAKRSLIYRLGFEPDLESLIESPESKSDMSRISNQASNTAALFAGISLATLAFVLSRVNPAIPSTPDGLFGVGMMLASFVMLAWSMALFTSAGMPAGRTILRALAFRRAEVLLGCGIFVFYGGLVWTLAVFNAMLYAVATIAYGAVYSVNMLAPTPVTAGGD